jgi:hypothetical protein
MSAANEIAEKGSFGGFDVLIPYGELDNER